VTPLVLAVDTTREFGSLALVRGARLLEELPMHAPSGFAHVLYEHLRELLERHRIAAADIDCFAAASGPGSFTGVRVGLACVKGLAEALGKAAVAVSNLQALSTFGTGRLRAVTIDARRGEIYGAVYDDAARLVSPEVVMERGAWLATLPPGALEFISEKPCLAAAVARLAAERFTRGEVCDPAALDANYVRRADAELAW
jgi:tRNA threonylcarbamoyladenosine biosynthesis protein TsaB